MSLKKLRAARSVDALYRREEAREALALWHAQDTSGNDYRETCMFETELIAASDRMQTVLRARLQQLHSPPIQSPLTDASLRRFHSATGM
jgi:hypothetical protein